MQGAVTLGSSSGLNATTVASASRLRDGVAQSLSYFWPSTNHGFHQKSLFLQKRLSEKSVRGTTTGVLRPIIVMANATTSGSGKPIAPLQPESPSGQFLVELLQSHPHLFSAAAEQQLEKLAEDRDATNVQEQSNTLGSELILYKRIAELRAQERRKNLEEIMYAIVSQRFVEAGISMVPTIASVAANQRVDNWPVQDKELEAVHSDEVLEMIREHLVIVLGGRGASDAIEQSTTAQISKLRMGRVYAASVVYGYFLRRVDQRFQLEKSMKILPPNLIEAGQANAHELVGNESNQQDGLVAEVVSAISSIVVTGASKQDPLSAGVRRPGVKASRLRAYVMSFGAETLHRSATIRSKESVSVIEKHTQALFGKPEIKMTRGGSMAVARDEVILLSFSGLRRLILEAVTFGSFLWDVETYVDTHYNIVG